MLIFVDKKKEKRRRIKIFCTIFCIIFFVIANIIHYEKTLHDSKNKLTNYHSHQISNDWYQRADIVYLFSSKQRPQLKIILIPSVFNRENATTTALAFSKLPHKKTHLIFMDDFPFKPALKKLSAIFFESADEQTAEQKVVLSATLNSIEELINQNQLYPMVLNYMHTQKLADIKNLTNLLNNLFPPLQTPKDKSEQEKSALQNFVSENLTAIKNIIFADKLPPFSMQKTFLKENRFCLQNNNKTKCKLHTHRSFEKNLQKLAHKFSLQNKPQKLILLTTDTPVSTETLTTLAKDEGLHFTYYTREAFLFPEDINSLAESKNALYILKQKAGLNPTYENPAMKLYKFKTLEVNLNDNI